VQETVVKAPGSVRRLSASVVVNDAAGPVDVQKVRDVVAAAIGYNPNREDQINVSSMAFDDSYQKKLAEEMAQADARAMEKERLYAYALAGGVLLAVLLTLVVLLIRRRRSAQRMTEEEVAMDEFIPVTAAELEQEQKAKDNKQKQIRDMANEHPEEIAEILKVWLKE